jgi:hypothetical protein
VHIRFSNDPSVAPDFSKTRRVTVGHGSMVGHSLATVGGDRPNKIKNVFHRDPGTERSTLMKALDERVISIDR